MKIEIRHAEPEDAEALQAIYTDEALYANTLQLPMPSNTLWRMTPAVKSVQLNLGDLITQLDDNNQTTPVLAIYSPSSFEFSFGCNIVQYIQ